MWFKKISYLARKSISYLSGSIRSNGIVIITKTGIGLVFLASAKVLRQFFSEHESQNGSFVYNLDSYTLSGFFEGMGKVLLLDAVTDTSQLIFAKYYQQNQINTLESNIAEIDLALRRNKKKKKRNIRMQYRKIKNELLETLKNKTLLEKRGDRAAENSAKRFKWIFDIMIGSYFVLTFLNPSATFRSLLGFTTDFREEIITNWEDGFIKYQRNTTIFSNQFFFTNPSIGMTLSFGVLLYNYFELLKNSHKSYGHISETPKAGLLNAVALLYCSHTSLHEYTTRVHFGRMTFDEFIHFALLNLKNKILNLSTQTLNENSNELDFYNMWSVHHEQTMETKFINEFYNFSMQLQTSADIAYHLFSVIAYRNAFKNIMHFLDNFIELLQQENERAELKEMIKRYERDDNAKHPKQSLHFVYQSEPSPAHISPTRTVPIVNAPPVAELVAALKPTKEKRKIKPISMLQCLSLPNEEHKQKFVYFIKSITSIMHFDVRNWL